MTDGTNETAENETQEVTLSSETTVSHDDEIVEGVIVDGTWVNPSIAADDPRRTQTTAQFSYTIPEGKPSFMRVVFGSVVMVSEEIRDRASDGAADDETQQMIQAAVNQAVSQEQSIDQRRFADLRYGTIGLVSGLLDGAEGGAGHLSGMTNAAARTAGKIIGPLWNSFLFAPFHEPVMRAEQAGESKVGQWIRRGRVEEVRSRAVAEVSINNFVEESVTEITENKQVQMIVQDVIASQSTSLAAELIDEARERLVSLDILLMSKLHRDLAATPDFRSTYLQTLANRRTRYSRPDLANSLAGTYAGPVSRLVAFLLDLVILIAVVGLVSSFVSSTLNLFGLTDKVLEFSTSTSTISAIVLALVGLFNTVVVAGYFIIAWNWTGATVGDMVFGLRVVNKNNNGGRVSAIRAILRFIGGIISAVFFFLGFIWALFDGRRQGWHDKFGGTFVLYDWPAKPDESFLNAQVMGQLEEEEPE